MLVCSLKNGNEASSAVTGGRPEPTSASAAGGAPGSPERSAGENMEGAPSPGRRSARSERAASLGTKEEVSLPTNAPTPVSSVCQAQRQGGGYYWVIDLHNILWGVKLELFSCA